MKQLTSLRQRISQKLDQRRYAIKQLKEERHSLSQVLRSQAQVTEAQQILQKVAQSIQQQAHVRISTIVSKCLAVVYPEDPYKFEIAFEKKRGKTEAVLRFTRKGHKVNPLKAAGGGPADVAAFALRLACLSLRQPQLRKLMVLDEPFKHVDAAAQERIKQMLEMLATEMGFQFILSTHSEQLKTGKVIKLKGKKYE
jgi:DNA repair exonuclease SbcCD ATPase subunit